MDRRKEELEKKRQKLAELRRAREERRAVLESQSNQTQSSGSVMRATKTEMNCYNKQNEPITSYKKHK